MSSKKIQIENKSILKRHEIDSLGVYEYQSMEESNLVFFSSSSSNRKHDSFFGCCFFSTIINLIFLDFLFPCHRQQQLI